MMSDIYEFVLQPDGTHTALVLIQTMVADAERIATEMTERHQWKRIFTARNGDQASILYRNSDGTYTPYRRKG